MTDCRDVRVVACAGQISLVCHYEMLPPETGPAREQTGFEPGSGPPQTGTTQYQMDPSVKDERVYVAESCWKKDT